MGEFFLITGSGKTGTSWLAEVLNHPKAGIVCWDEGKFPRQRRLRAFFRKFRFLRSPWIRYRSQNKWLRVMDNRVLGWDVWLDYAEYELENGLGPKFDYYFESIESLVTRHAAVGDSHSWDPHIIPMINNRIMVSRIIHLVRNGIPNVNALATHNAELFERSTVIRRQIDRYREMFGGECESAWEYWCFWWSINLEVPDWLRANVPGVPIDVFRLEDLSQDITRLEQLLENIHSGSSKKIRDLKSLQRKNQNRDQTGDRTPADIWHGWTEDQQETFRRICGAAMEHYGYPIP